MASPRQAAAKRLAAVVALGASAGGLESLGRVLGGLPRAFSLPVLVVLHLDPNHRSEAVAILRRRTTLRVVAAKDGTVPRRGCVYLAPPNLHLALREGRLRLLRAARVHYSRPSIDLLFESVAREAGPGAIVAILSGAGEDGTQGIRAVRAAGGSAIAEASSTARFPSMPEAAARTGLLDAVLRVDLIPAFLARAAQNLAPVTGEQWDRVFALLEARTGTSFTRYRTPTLQRRLQYRLAVRSCATVDAYLGVLAREPEEVDRLAAAFLIKVSSFFRDPPAWRHLERELAARPAGDVRAWSAGCATGEEAFSLALALAHRYGTAAKWKVFATDLDDGALRAARAATYGASKVKGVPRADLRRFFVQQPGGWRVGPALRRRVVFGRHDLLKDPPLTRMDIVACRNVLIYFTPEERERVTRRLAQALAPGGLLFLGRSEAVAPPAGFHGVGHAMLKQTTHVASDVPPTRRAAVRPKQPAPTRRSRAPAERIADEDLLAELQSRNEELETVNEELQSLNDELTTVEAEMRSLAQSSQQTNDFLRLVLDTASKAFIACDARNRILFWNKAAARRFHLSSTQAVGGDLFKLVPSLSTLALRGAAQKARKATQKGPVTVVQDAVEFVFDPLPAAGGARGYLLRVRGVGD